MFIINTPFIFKTIWAFVNPMLEDRTRRKIIVLGTVRGRDGGRKGRHCFQLCGTGQMDSALQNLHFVS